MILVTGFPGMLAADVVARLQREDHVIGTARSDLDITSPDSTARCLDRHQPVTIVNCAGMTNVDACERDPAAAHAANAEGPRLLARACAARGIDLIHISTDYVFDGTKGAPYIESDSTNPINAYGHSKLEGERAVQEHTARHKILRVSMIYGVHRTNFADFVATCAEKGEPVKALSDNAGSPTYTVDIAEQIAALIGHPFTGTFHCAGLGGCTRVEFAERIRELLPAPDLRIEAVTRAEFPQMIARRPLNTGLDCARLRELGLLRLRPWPEALEVYLEERRSVRLGRSG